jgi:Putative prokaryotic signal transducing protein
MFKKSDPTSGSERIVNNFILLLFLLMSISISVLLYREQKYHEFSGWLIISLLIILFLSVYNIKQKSKSKTNFANRQLNYNKASISDGLVLLYSTKDSIVLQKIIAILEKHGIDYHVFDLHAASMMNFLSEVQMKIMVNNSDYEHSIKIVNNELKHTGEKPANDPN